MFRVLFLLLIGLSTIAFAQTKETPKAVKFDEFEKATNGYVKLKMDYFYNELSNNPASQGYIINYGTDREIFIREKQIRVSMTWRKYDAARITFVRGGFRDGVKSEFWMVPPGADKPEPNSSAKKVDEFEKLPDYEEAIARVENFYVALGKNPNLQGYILNFGSPKAIAARESQIKKYISFRKLLLSRVTFKTGGFEKTGRTEFWIQPAKSESGVKTKIWIVPPGAKPPIN
jgi:hypothetical protein